MSERVSGDSRGQWIALARVILGSLWLLWAVSLWFSMFMLWVFDSEVSVRDGAMYGAFHATWVAGTPVALLFVGHVAFNGLTRPKWELRWIAIAVAALVWVAIFALWVLGAATDEAYAYHQILSSMSEGRSS